MQFLDSYFLMIMVLVFIIFVLLFILSGLVVLKEWERVVIFRLGKYLGIKGPGIIWKTPILDYVVLKASLQDQSTDVDTGRYISSEASTRRVEGVVAWRIEDLKKYALSIDNHQQSIAIAIHHHVLKVAESMMSDAVYFDVDELNSEVEAALEPTFSKWGLQIIK
ncbi:MAG: SPFH domain-containing protein, partial [Candidatus Thorarchaeota archaeon SMTZ1-45]